MTNSRDIQQHPTRLWRWLLGIVGANVALIMFGFLVPASDEQIYVTAVQHLLRAEGLTSQSRRRAVAYVQTEEPLSADARESLTEFAAYAGVRLRWVNDMASMALEAERNIESGGYLFVLGAPRRGFIFSNLDAETHVVMGGGRSQLSFFSWMGVSEVWQEREIPRVPFGDQ